MPFGSSLKEFASNFKVFGPEWAHLAGEDALRTAEREPVMVRRWRRANPYRGVIAAKRTLAKIVSLKKSLSVALGMLLVLLGIVGLVLPIMPGWVFLIPGLIILAEHFHWARRLLEWAKSKAPNWNRKQQDPPSG